MLRLHKMWVKNISLFCASKHAVNDFRLFPVNVLHAYFTCSVYSSINLIFSLRCSITTYCIRVIAGGY